MERGGGAAAVPFEDPLWNFKRGGRRGRVPSLALLEDPLWNFKRGGAPPAPPPPESASACCNYLRSIPCCVTMRRNRIFLPYIYEYFIIMGCFFWLNFSAIYPQETWGNSYVFPWSLRAPVRVDREVSVNRGVRFNQDGALVVNRVLIGVRRKVVPCLVLPLPAPGPWRQQAELARYARCPSVDGGAGCLILIRRTAVKEHSFITVSLSCIQARTRGGEEGVGRPPDHRHPRTSTACHLHIVGSQVQT